MGWGSFAALFGAFLLLSIIIAIASYVYFALVWFTIAKKLGYKNPWLAWIPVANLAMILQLGGFHWAWIFLLLIPILGWIAVFVLMIISTWRIFEKRKYPGWLSLAPLLSINPFIGGIAGIAFLVILGIVAWVDKK
jgi:hypothetical protein